MQRRQSNGGTWRIGRFFAMLAASLMAVGKIAIRISVLMLVIGTANANTLYWVAGEAGDWSDASNWATNSGGTGGEGVVTAPGGANNAIFDGNGLGDCVFDAEVDVLGFRLEAGYNGTITQNDHTVTIGSGGYFQTNGVFAGGTADITVQGLPNRFELAGGIFTNTTATLTLTGGYVDNTTLFLFSGGSFQHNNGTVRLDVRYNNNASRTYTASIQKPLTLNHMIVAGENTSARSFSYALDIEDEADLIVEGDFTMERIDPTSENTAFMLNDVNNGTIQVKGNILFGRQGIGGSVTLLVNGTGNQTYTSGGGHLPIVVVDKPTGAFAPSNCVDVRVNRFSLLSGDFVAPSGTFTVASGSETYSLFTFTGGSFDHNHGTLRLASSWANNRPGISKFTIHRPLTLNHLVYSGGAGDSGRTLIYELDIVSPGELLVTGDFFFERMDDTETRTLCMNLGTLEIQGNIAVGPGTTGGTTQILMSGANDQTIAQTTNGVPPRGHWTLDKSSGAAILATDLALSGASQDLLWKNGSLDLGTNTLHVGRNVEIESGAATFGVAITDDGVTSGRLTADGTVSGIDNTDLRVSIFSPPIAVKDQSYVILSNATALVREFASVTWYAPKYDPAPHGWKCVVDYTAVDGKVVTLRDIRPPTGTIFMFR